MISSQMLKGTLEGCILKIISKEETYGYEIVQKLQEFGFHDVNEGTIYPLLLRLQKNNAITATMKSSSIGPNRKYYRISEKGRLDLDDFYKGWIELNLIVNSLLKDK
ncbi:PadR family transcriptional regulator, regulatory protein PadR [Peptostreptococcaceae bacterium pGA-8]|nr:PadR family transcriptional regulator, regulatory protein PadR [Peptostreptococcaceae bacterium pGA-8]